MQSIEFQIFHIRGCRIIGTDIIFDTISGSDRTVRLEPQGWADCARETDSAWGELEKDRTKDNGKIILSPIVKVYLSGSLA